MKNITKISIGGEERPIKFGMNQSILYCEERGITLEEMSKELSGLGKDSGATLRDLFWSALKDGARVEKQPFDYSTGDVADWLEDLTEADYEQFFKALAESTTKKKSETAPKPRRKPATPKS